MSPTSSRPSKRDNPLPFLPSVAALLWVLVLTGCARPPWTEPVDEQRHQHLVAVYEQQREQGRRCGDGFDGDMVLHWETSLESVSLAGYYQIQRPSSLRLTVANPLGQPLLAVASNGVDYQVLHVPRRTFYSGSLRSYALRHQLPLPMLVGPWFDRLTGRPIGGGVRIEAVSDDRSGRGVWFTLVTDKEPSFPVEHLLMEPDGGGVVERIVVGEDGEMHARVTYADWQPIGPCLQPLQVTVAGLSFWADARITFSDVQPASLQPSDFKLRPPAGYLRQLSP